MFFLGRMVLYFIHEFRDTQSHFPLFLSVQIITKLDRGRGQTFELKIKIWPSWFTISGQHRIWSFHVVVLQKTAMKCTENYNARAQPLFSSLNLLFSDVPVDVKASGVAITSCSSVRIYSYFNLGCRIKALNLKTRPKDNMGTS